jgi:hypothetical protein
VATAAADRSLTWIHGFQPRGWNKKPPQVVTPGAAHRKPRRVVGVFTLRGDSA